MTRILAIGDPNASAGPQLPERLRAAIGAAIDYGLIAIERGEERAPAPPPVLLAQARYAARASASLDTILRHYLAGHTVLSDFLIQESEKAGLRRKVLNRILRDQAVLLDRLLAAVAEEHTRETRDRPRSSAQRRAQRIERLLAGEPLDTSELDYDFDAHHIALIGVGSNAAELIRELVASLDRRLLLIERDETTVWAWLGGRRKHDAGDLHSRFCTPEPPKGCLSMGEPGEGIAGWRLSHRQAKAALAIVTHKAEFVDASPSGDDVFFSYQQSLVDQDTDKLVDIYDARAGGGSAQPPAACEGEVCQPPLEVPNDPTPANSAFEGAGNVTNAAKPPCAKGKVRRKGRCVARKHRRHHTHKRAVAPIFRVNRPSLR